MIPLTPLVPLSAINGRFIGSIILAQILYKTEFAYSTDNGEGIILNQGSGDNDLLMNAGAGVELGATNDLPIPVGYDLGVDDNNTSNPTLLNSDETTTFTVIASDSFNLAVTSIGTNNEFPRVQTNLTFTTVGDERMLIEFNAVVNSGTPIIRKYIIGGTGLVLDYPVVNGYNKIEVGAGGVNNRSRFYFDGTQLFDVEITDWTAKQITTTGYLTYETDDGVVQIGNAVDGGSSEEYIDFTQAVTLGDGWTDNGDGSYTCDGTNVASSDLVLQLPVLKLGYLESKATFSNYSSGRHRCGITGLLSPWSTGNGETVYSIENLNVSGTFTVRADELTPITVSLITCKEILPNSTTYTLVDDTYRWAYVNENPFSEADLTAIAKEPNKIVEFALDNANSDLDNTQGVSDGFYGFRDDDATNPERCYDALSSAYADITSYVASIRENVDQSTKGIQWTCAELDGAGVPTSYDNTQMHFHGNEFGDTQWTVTGNYIVEEAIYDGTNYVFVAYLSTGSKYTNGVPDGTFTAPTGTYLLNDTRFDGTTDAEQINHFKAITDQTQIDNYDATEAFEQWEIDNFGLKDESGNYLTDESGNILIGDY